MHLASQYFFTKYLAPIIGPIPWGHSGPLCHALSLSLSSSSLSVVVVVDIDVQAAHDSTGSDIWLLGVRRLAVANGPNIFQMLLVRKIVSLLAHKSNKNCKQTNRHFRESWKVVLTEFVPQWLQVLLTQHKSTANSPVTWALSCWEKKNSLDICHMANGAASRYGNIIIDRFYEEQVSNWCTVDYF